MQTMEITYYPVFYRKVNTFKKMPDMLTRMHTKF